MLPSDEPFVPQMSRIEDQDAMALRFAADAIAAHRAFVYNPTSFESDRLRDAGVSWPGSRWTVSDTAPRFPQSVVHSQGVIRDAVSLGACFAAHHPNAQSTPIARKGDERWISQN